MTVTLQRIDTDGSTIGSAITVNAKKLTWGVKDSAQSVATPSGGIVVPIGSEAETLNIELSASAADFAIIKSWIGKVVLHVTASSYEEIPTLAGVPTVAGSTGATCAVWINRQPKITRQAGMAARWTVQLTLQRYYNWRSTAT